MPTPSQIAHAEANGNPTLWASDAQSDALGYMETLEQLARQIEDIGNWTGDVQQRGDEWVVEMDYAGNGPMRTLSAEDWLAEAELRLVEVLELARKRKGE